MNSNLQKNSENISPELLKKSEKYENLFKHANDAILIFEPEGEIILEVNDRACALYGRRREDFVGRSLKEMSQNVSRGTEEMRKLLHDGIYEEFESVHLRGDGVPLNMTINAAVIEYQGKPAILTINRDVSHRKQMEEKLREREEHLFSIANSAQDAIVSADSRGKIIFWNDGARKFFGYDEQEIIGKPVSLLMPEKYRKLYIKGMRRYTETGEKRGIENVVELQGLRKDGSKFPLELSLGVWETAEGKYFSGVMRDVTERKLAADAIKESERRYRMLGEGIMHQVWTTQPDGTLDYVNQQTLAYFGMTSEKYRESKLKDIVHPEDLPTVIENWFHAHKTGEDFEAEYRLKRADEVYRWHTGRATAGRDAEGNIIKWFGTSTDIHNQKIAEEFLRESEERFRLLVEGVQDYAILMLDPDGYVISWNAGAERVKQYKAEEIIGSHFRIFYAPKDQEREYPEEELRIASANGRFEDEGWRIRKDGSRFWANVIITTIKNDEGHLQGFSKITRDITERKQAEEELNKKEEFLRAILENLNDNIVACDAEGKLTLFNKTTSESYELPEASVPPEEWAERFELYQPDGKTLMRMEDVPLYRALHEGSVRNAEMATIAEDGRMLTMIANGQALIDEHNQKLGAVVVMHDITERKKTENALRKNEQKYRELFENANDVLYTLDLTGGFTSLNKAGERLTGYTREEALQRNIADVIAPADAARVRDRISRNVKGAGLPNFELEIIAKDGSIATLDISSRLILQDGVPVGIQGIGRDITERKQTEKALRESEYKLRTLLTNMSEGLLQVDNDERIEYVNDRFCEMTGYKDEELLGKVTFDIIYNDEGRKFVNEVNRQRLKGVSGQYELNLRKKNGEMLYMIVGGVPIINAAGEVTGTMGVFTDITERKRAEEQLLHDAFHDGLTGLANRALFMDHLRMTIERGRRNHNALFAVLFLDFDRFKVINDSLGHAEGDNFLKLVARRLESVLRPGDLVARLGGDEFTILLSELGSENNAVQVAERIQEDLKKPFDLGGREIFITASVGITLSSAGHNSAEDMVRDADIAMYRAKARGRAQHQVFDRVMHEQASKQLQLETEMRYALEREEFQLHYQPIMKLATGKLVGFEALVRWKHPERGLIPPFEFIGAAEENGLILPLGAWILQESCRQLRHWQDNQPAASHLTVSVNLSSKQFSQSDLTEQIAATLEATGLDPRYLKLEITESHLMENSETAITMLDRLRALGIELSLDDFGTGYSSLSYLHRLPVNYLKVDRSFVMRMLENEENSEIVSTIIKLAQNLKMKVVAEGIETADQLAHLKNLNCEYGQGYFFSKPIEAKAAEMFIDKGLLTAADFTNQSDGNPE